MALVPPNLDDRTFHDLVSAGKERIRLKCPEWTDLSPHDPGIALLEAFAHITETMIYRLNRLPDKVYVELLRLIGVNIRPPTAASTMLRFELSAPAERMVDIPEGTHVSTAGGGSGKKVGFLTTRGARIEAGQKSVDVIAHAAEFSNGELVGEGSGLPGLWVKARRVPIVAKSDPGLGIVLGVEATEEEVARRAPARTFDGKIFRLWEEVENFSSTQKNEYVFIADRATGVISFPPAARLSTRDGDLTEGNMPLGAVPQKGREIRAWYYWGGGAAGNLPPGTLTRIDSTIPLPRGVTIKVTNPNPATGGHAAETLDNALTRGPIELRSLERAVTAADFEQLALTTSRDIARARAYAAIQVWKHAALGTVEVLVVPSMTEADPPVAITEISLDRLITEQDEAKRLRLQQELDRRRPIGTHCAVKWARYKSVKVKARVVPHRGEDADNVRRRVLTRLHSTINPLPTRERPTGWPFGQPLRSSNVYDLLLSEPGVSYVDQLQLIVDRAPGNTSFIDSGRSQPGLWFAGSEKTIFRSINDAQSWEPVKEVEGKEITAIATHPDRAGLIAVAVLLEKEDQTRIYYSADSGETWEDTVHVVPRVHSLAWMTRESMPVLLIATDVGLFDLSMAPGIGPLQVLVDEASPDRGFYSVAVAAGERGAVKVAVAGKGSSGVFLSVDRGAPGSFKNIGLAQEDVRVLEVQYDGPRSFLWAGAAAQGGGDPGKGCWRWELTGVGNAPPEGWKRFGKGWQGGSCTSLSFLEGDGGGIVLAGTHQAGVQRLDPRAADPVWTVPALTCGLPLRARERLFYRVRTLGCDGKLALVGMEAGIFSSADGGVNFEHTSKTVFTDKVTIPPNLLLCSGEHELDVVSEDETT
jgi:hypothetical protein